MGFGVSTGFGTSPTRLSFWILLAALALCGCAEIEPRRPIRIEAAPAAEAVSTAHPLASHAALEMLARGGTPIDAAIAAQMVLGLVEPQSSGVGGGSLVMLWDASARKLTSFDGLAAAPARVTPGLRIDVDGALLPRASVRRSGRAVGIPGTAAVLKLAHERYGRLPWSALFAPAIRHAEAGFALPPYLHAILSRRNAARDYPQMVALYFGPDGSVLSAGSVVHNPQYASTMRRLAERGPSGLYDEGGAERWIAAARSGHPTLVTADDLRRYRAEERTPVCAPFLAYTVCTAAPPSFGGVAVLQILQLVEARARGRYDFADPDFAHLYLEAGRLAQADRRRYVGDPAFVDVPSRELVASDYLRRRAELIDPDRAQSQPAPGNPAGARSHWHSDTTEQHPATSQIAIVDRAGNAVSVTTTINLNFGARLMVDGYVLNNAMINFSPAPAPDRPTANRMAAGKRPVSAMTPTIVFGPDGEPAVVGGAAGGGYIVDYVAATLIDMLANDRTPAEALARGHLSSAVPRKVRLEKGSAAEALAPALSARGHSIEIAPMLSGLGFLKRSPAGWLGAADPRRDGTAEGR